MCCLSEIYFMLLLFMCLCQCQKSPHSKIVGGFNCHPSRVPYFAILWVNADDYTLQCGASILHANWALTAGHCFAKVMYDGNYTVQTGVTMVKTNQFSQSSKVRRLVLVDKYHENTHRDIGLLELETAILENRFTAYARLVTPSIYTRLIEEQRCNMSITMGFGYKGVEYENGTKEPNIENPVLQCVFQWVKPESQCELALMICATGSPVQKMDTCGGDSGGPLVCEGFQIGIVSSGIGCGMGKAFYTKITKFYYFLKMFVPGLADDITATTENNTNESITTGKSSYFLNLFSIIVCLVCNKNN